MWIHIVEALTWKDLKAMFDPEWISQWDAMDNETKIGNEILQPYKHLTMDNCNKFISKYTPNTSAAGRAAKAAKDSSIKVIVGHTKYAGRQDKGKARKFQDIESDMLQIVQCG
jgi:hypothetical protein